LQGVGQGLLDGASLRRKAGGIVPKLLQVADMKIVANSPERLTLEERPWILGVILAGVILIFLSVALLTVAENIWLGVGMGFGAAMFGMAFVIFVRRVIVIFDRGAKAVVIRSVSLLGQKEQTLALTDLRGAIVETSISHSTGSSSGGRRRRTTMTHRPSLQTAQGVVPLTEIYSGGKGAERAVAAITDWLGEAS
jgi:hypothetical protein